MPDEPVEMPEWLSLVDEHDGLEALNRRQLIARAKAAGIRGYSRMRVDELVAALRAQQVGRHEEAWRKLAPLLERMGVLTKADEIVLAMVIDVYIEYLELRAAVQRSGRVYATEGKSGRMFRKRPEVEMLQDAWRRLMIGLRELGMTSPARSRMKVEGLEPADPMEGLFE